jgi:hypothetical protein
MEKNVYPVFIVLVVALVAVGVMISGVSTTTVDLTGQAKEVFVKKHIDDRKDVDNDDVDRKGDTRQAFGLKKRRMAESSRSMEAGSQLMPSAELSLQPPSVSNLIGEFQIDSIPMGMGSALYPDVGATVDKFMVAWRNFPSPLGRADIAAKVYDANTGSTLTGDISVTDVASSLDVKDVPHIAVFDNGGFVVTWGVGDDADPFADVNDVIARVYDSSFNAITPEFMVHPSTTGVQWGADVAALSNGNFVVVWAEYLDASNPTVVLGQLFDSLGNAIGSPFQINPSVQNTPLFSGYPRVAASQNDEFIVVWEGQDKEMRNLLWEQRFDNNANTIGSALQVNTPGVTGPTSSTSSYSGSFMSGHYDVSYLYDGSFVISFAFGKGTSQGISFEVYVKHYTSSGNAMGPEFLVHQPTQQSFSLGPAIIGKMFQNSYVPIWTSIFGGDHDVYRKTYDLQDTPLGSEVLVNTITTNDQSSPAITSYRSGYVVVWHGFNSAGYTHVYGQMFDNADTPI